LIGSCPSGGWGKHFPHHGATGSKSKSLVRLGDLGDIGVETPLLGDIGKGALGSFSKALDTARLNSFSSSPAVKRLMLCEPIPSSTSSSASPSNGSKFSYLTRPRDSGNGNMAHWPRAMDQKFKAINA